MSRLILSRFRYHDPITELIYVGEAWVDEYEVNLTQVWEYGTILCEIFPYDTKFPYILRRMLEITAREQAMCPPIAPVELPTDWDDIEILDAETTYTVAAKSIALPEVKSDREAQAFGLSAVRRIVATEGAYKVTASGQYSDIRAELYRARLF